MVQVVLTQMQNSVSTPFCSSAVPNLTSTLAIVLTTWHLTFATIMTQIMARTTTLLDGRKKVKMTGRVYLRAILPIGFFFSLSLICGNKAYLYLSVAFIQMLKVELFHTRNQGVVDSFTGNYSSRRAFSHLGSRTCPPQLENARQRFLHRHWRHDCNVWGNRLRSDWLPVPSRRHHL